MKPRLLTALAVLALVAGCATQAAQPAVTVTPANVMPGGAEPVTAAPNTSAGANAGCNREQSSPPLNPMPVPGAMPPGSTMASIADRGRLVVGVDQDTTLFGSRNTATGELEGFDIDVARELARSIFGDPDRIDFKVVTAAQREAVLRDGLVDLVVRTYSITCERRNVVDFSTTYFLARQRILAVKGAEIRSSADLSGKKVCVVRGTTSLTALLAISPAPTVYGVNAWTDCLVMLQQGQVDAISTDDAVLAGLKHQDPANVELVGNSLGDEPYGVGVKKGNEDLVRFVNGALDRMRTDGTWQRLYDRWLLNDLGPTSGPPVPQYEN